MKQGAKCWHASQHSAGLEAILVANLRASVSKYVKWIKFSKRKTTLSSSHLKYKPLIKDIIRRLYTTLIFSFTRNCEINISQTNMLTSESFTYIKIILIYALKIFAISFSKFLFIPNLYFLTAKIEQFTTRRSTPEIPFKNNMLRKQANPPVKHRWKSPQQSHRQSH